MYILNKNNRPSCFSFFFRFAAAVQNGATLYGRYSRASSSSLCCSGLRTPLWLNYFPRCSFYSRKHVLAKGRVACSKPIQHYGLCKNKSRITLAFDVPRAYFQRRKKRGERKNAYPSSSGRNNMHLRLRTDTHSYACVNISIRACIFTFICRHIGAWSNIFRLQHTRAYRSAKTYTIRRFICELKIELYNGFDDIQNGAHFRVNCSLVLSTTTISDRLPHLLLFYVSNWPTDCMSVPSKKTFASKNLAENQPFSTKQDCHVAKHKKRALHYSDLC